MEVLVKPLEARLSVPAGGNLLDALLEHRVPISYSCMSGRCGTCRCTVLDGEVSGPGAAEGRPSIGGHTVLACQSRVHGDCTIEVPEPDEIIVHPARKLKAEVLEFDALTHDVRRLRLRTNKPLSFSPGQYAHLRFSNGLIRPYSMAGLPTDDTLEFHIRLVPDGRVTPWLESHLKVGDRLRVSGPLGVSYLRRKHQAPILCVAGGTGFAPMYAVARGALTSGMPNPVHFLFGVRTGRDVYGVEQLDALARRYDNFSYQIALSDSGDVRTVYRGGLVTDVMREDFPRMDDWHVYVAGPPPMTEAVDTLAVRSGVSADHIYADAFFPAGI